MYQLGEARTLTTETKEGELTIIIKDANRRIEIPAKRWVTFVLQLADIEEAVKQLRDRQYVKYHRHIGGGWYVSVTTGFWCVDIRRFYKKDDDIKPTRRGLALRLKEWTDLLAVIPRLLTDVPKLVAVLPCYCGDDHQNQLGYLQCPECSPFETFM